MTRKSTVRSITLPDEVFSGLKMAAAVKGTTISKILETLAREYLKENSATMKQDLQHQLALFDYFGGEKPQT